MDLPLVSVIITTYNRKAYLEEAIISVINQAYKNFEILIIDDGSKENYAESICSKYDKCLYYYKKNGGVSSARNFGIRKSNGNYIAFLDDDDYWKKEKLKIQVDLLIKNPSIDCVHSPLEVVNEFGNLLHKQYGASKEKALKRSGYVFWNALGTWLVKASTPLIRKKVFTDELMFDEGLEVGEDVDFYQRMFYKHKVLYVSEPLAYYREYIGNNKLSNQTEKYLGLEKRIYNNFVKMKVSNPIIIYFIAKILLKSAVKNNNIFKPKNKINLSFIDVHIFPKKTIKLLTFK